MKWLARFGLFRCVMIAVLSTLTYLVFSVLLSSFSYFSFVVILSLSVFYIILYSGLPFISLSMIRTLFSGLVDEYRITLNLILYIVLFMRFVVFKIKRSISRNIESLGIVIFLLLFVSSLVVFRSSRLFWVYFGYEMSLIPIIIIIMVWGAYPERMYSAITMLLYTLFFRFPLMGVILYGYIGGWSFSLVLRSSPYYHDTFLIICAVVVFCSFAVKLPIYGLHYWLPLAHVEAPTFGRMLLAGVLLKLGGSTIYRFFTYYSFGMSLFSVILSLLFLGMVLSSFVCCFQSDIKRLIAYSSVVHITRVGAGLLTSRFLGFKRGLIIIFMHGFSSPLIFFIVGEVYELIGTRLLLLIRGFYFLSPIMFWGIVITFFLTTPVPPVLAFLGEVILFTSLISVSYKVLILSFIYIFLAVVFNLYWLRTRFGQLLIRSFVSLSISTCWVLIYFPVVGFSLIFLSFLF